MRPKEKASPIQGSLFSLLRPKPLFVPPAGAPKAPFARGLARRSRDWGFSPKEPDAVKRGKPSTTACGGGPPPFKKGGFSLRGTEVFTPPDTGCRWPRAWRRWDALY